MYSHLNKNVTEKQLIILPKNLACCTNVLKKLKTPNKIFISHIQIVSKFMKTSLH